MNLSKKMKCVKLKKTIKNMTYTAKLILVEHLLKLNKGIITDSDNCSYIINLGSLNPKNFEYFSRYVEMLSASKRMKL